MVSIQVDIYTKIENIFLKEFNNKKIFIINFFFNINVFFLVINKTSC